MMFWIVGIGVLAICLWLFCYYNNNHLSISKYGLELSGDQPFRIVQLSDLHGKQFGKGNHRLYRAVEMLKPDLIAFTGDLIDDDLYNVPETVDFFCSLVNICPVVYIFGNHEHRAKVAGEIGDRLRKEGITVLDNQVCDMQIRGNVVSILGLNEGLGTDKKFYKERMRGNFVYEDNSRYFEEFSRHEGIKIVMSHFPETFDNPKGYTYKNYDYDLQLSGHAHGGQFRLPVIGGVYSPGQGINPRFYQGLHGDRPKMIVSRGLGNSSFPLRLFNCPEIVVIDMEKK